MLIISYNTLMVPFPTCTCSLGCPAALGLCLPATLLSCHTSQRPLVHIQHRNRYQIGSKSKQYYNITISLQTLLAKPTAILPLLLLLGLGTWKFRPSKSVRSSSSLELELSRVLIPLDRELSPNLG